MTVNWNGDGLRPTESKDRPRAMVYEVVTEIESARQLVAARLTVTDSGALVAEDEHGEMLYAIAPLFWVSARRVR